MEHQALRQQLLQPPPMHWQRKHRSSQLLSDRVTPVNSLDSQMRSILQHTSLERLLPVNDAMKCMKQQPTPRLQEMSASTTALVDDSIESTTARTQDESIIAMSPKMKVNKQSVLAAKQLSQNLFAITNQKLRLFEIPSTLDASSPTAITRMKQKNSANITKQMKYLIVSQSNQQQSFALNQLKPPAYQHHLSSPTLNRKSLIKKSELNFSFTNPFANVFSSPVAAKDGCSGKSSSSTQQLPTSFSLQHSSFSKQCTTTTAVGRIPHLLPIIKNPGNDLSSTTVSSDRVLNDLSIAKSTSPMPSSRMNSQLLLVSQQSKKPLHSCLPGHIELRQLPQNFTKILHAQLTASSDFFAERLDESLASPQRTNCFMNFIIRIVETIIAELAISPDEVILPLKQYSTLAFKFNEEIASKIIKSIKQALHESTQHCSATAVNAIIANFLRLSRLYFLKEPPLAALHETSFNSILAHLAVSLSSTYNINAQDEIVFKRIHTFALAVIKEDKNAIELHIRANQFNRIGFTLPDFFKVKLLLMHALSSSSTQPITEQSSQTRQVQPPREIPQLVMWKLEKIRYQLFPRAMYCDTGFSMRLAEVIRSQSNSLVNSDDESQTKIVRSIIHGFSGQKSLQEVLREIEAGKCSSDDIKRAFSIATLRSASEDNLLSMRDVRCKLDWMSRISDYSEMEVTFADKVFTLSRELSTRADSTAQRQNHVSFLQFLMFSVATKLEIYSVYDIEAAKKHFEVNANSLWTLLSEFSMLLAHAGYAKTHIVMLITTLKSHSLLYSDFL